jgi:hypothetical protein
MDENPYRSPRETGYRPPAEPAKSFNYVNVAVVAFLTVITLSILFFAYAYVVSFLGAHW